MPIVLYDLVGSNDRRYSPYCWRIRMAIAHKGLACQTRPTRLVDISSIADGSVRQVPAVQDGDRLVVGSFAIAEYLEVNYPDKPSLFGGRGGLAAARVFNAWVGTAVVPQLPYLIVLDTFEHAAEQDQPYLRKSREKFFGMTLEQVQANRNEKIAAFRAGLAPVRDLVSNGSFIGGAAPLYTDYQLFGAFQWARAVSDFAIFSDDDPLLAWFRRCMDLYDGLGHQTPGYWG